MANTLSNTGIVTGQTVEALQVSQSVDAFTGANDYDITISGSLTLTGSLLQTGSVFFKQLVDVPATASGQLGAVMIDVDGRLYSGSSSVGSQGAAGEKGENGSQGTTGEKGVDGTQGTTGTQGTVGTTGANGPQGITGEKGAEGTQGADGVKGSTGEKGTFGEKGEAGAAGAKGEAGEKGVDGEKGADGTQGTNGEKGENGPTGPQGTTGTQGATGEKGKTATQGETGAGDKGQKGEQGSAGGAGEKGELGPVGPTGTQGTTGTTGTQGTTGEKGSEGSSGGSGDVYNPQTRYLVASSGTDFELYATSTSNMFTATWSRLGTTLSISGSGIGLGVGDKVIVRNTNVDYQVIDVTGVTADGFEGNCGNTGGTSGTEAVYGTLFTAAVTQTSGDVTAIVISAPGGTQGASQLNALSLYANNQESGLSVTLPAGLQEGAGGYNDKQDINIIDVIGKGADGTGSTTAITPATSFQLGSNFNQISISGIDNFSPVLGTVRF